MSDYSSSQRLKILAVSNLYPPHYMGGYELGCRDVLTGLRERGHDITVLTSQYGVDKPCVEQGDIQVHRTLQANIPGRKLRPQEFWKRVIQFEMHNQAEFQRIYEQVQPDLVSFWNLGGISYSLLPLSRRLKARTVTYVSDDWPCRIINDRLYRLAQILKRLRLLGAFRQTWNKAGREVLDIPVRLEEALYTSDYMRRAIQESGVSSTATSVVPWGIELDSFPATISTEARRLLYVGQIVAHKGVKTVLEAFELLQKEHPEQGHTLTIVGGTTEPEYLSELTVKAALLPFPDRCRFAGRLPREQLSSIYREHDVLVFPSLWEEPFSIGLLEGMASGLAVVATPTGGTPEIIEHEENGLIFPSGDSRRCANRLISLVRNPELTLRLRKAGRKTIESRYTLSGMIDTFERELYAGAGR